MRFRSFSLSVLTALALVSGVAATPASAQWSGSRYPDSGYSGSYNSTDGFYQSNQSWNSNRDWNDSNHHEYHSNGDGWHDRHNRYHYPDHYDYDGYRSDREWNDRWYVNNLDDHSNQDWNDRWYVNGRDNDHYRSNWNGWTNPSGWYYRNGNAYPIYPRYGRTGPVNGNGWYYRNGNIYRYNLK